MMTNTERYSRRVSEMIEDANDTLEAFKNALAQNPQYAFNFHGDRAAEAAARLDVA